MPDIHGPSAVCQFPCERHTLVLVVRQFSLVGCSLAEGLLQAPLPPVPALVASIQVFSIQVFPLPVQSQNWYSLLLDTR